MTHALQVRCRHRRISCGALRVVSPHSREQRSWPGSSTRTRGTWPYGGLGARSRTSSPPTSPGACATALQYLSQARHADEHSLQSSNMLGLGMIITLPPGATLALDFVRGTATAKGGDVSLKIGKPQYCLLPVTNRGVTFEPPCPLGEVIHRHGACNSRTTGTDRNFKRYLYSGVFGSTLPGALRLSLAQAACTLPLWQICSSVGYSLSYSNLEAARTAGARREHASSLSP